MENVKIGFSQFFKNNTPKRAQIIGDIALVLAFVSSLPMLIPASVIALPAAVITASVYATTGLTVVKIFSKYFGIKLPEEIKD